MEIDGKQIAADILKSVAQEVEALDKTPSLSAITCAPNFETQKYLQMKKNRSAKIGISLNVIELSAQVTTQDVIDRVLKVAEEADGIVVQLPLPEQIDVDAVIESIPVDKDPDGFHYGNNKLSALPPVVGAIDEISKRYNIDWKGKKVVILGEGRLVGAPAAHYAQETGATVVVLNQDNFNLEAVKQADILISGIGQPNFIKAESIKDGAVVFDAGTSEDGGVLVGDVDPAVTDKVSLITPVPGGIGPITIACLLKSLVSLISR